MRLRNIPTRLPHLLYPVIACGALVVTGGPLAGYLERADGRVLTFAVMLNSRMGRHSEAVVRIDSVVVQMAR